MPVKRPVAPPVYRPQPVPKVLQAKMQEAHPPLSSSPRPPVASSVRRPLPAPRVAQTKTTVARQPRTEMSPQHRVATPVSKPHPIIRPGRTIQSKSALPARPVVVQCALTKSSFKRPKFDAKTYYAGAVAFNLDYDEDVDPRDPEMKRHNAALPHRTPWTYLRDRTLRMLNGTEDTDTFYRWTQRIIEGGEQAFHALGQKHHVSTKAEKKQIDVIMQSIGVQTSKLTTLRDQMIKDYDRDGVVDKAVVSDFLKTINSYIPNVYGWGPHSGVNTRVQDRFHSHVVEGSATPLTRAAWQSTPDSKWPIALTPRGEHIVGVDGRAYDPDDLTPESRGLFDVQEQVVTRADVSSKWGGKKRRRNSI
jgi:hypothetical protein